MANKGDKHRCPNRCPCCGAEDIFLHESVCEWDAQSKEDPENKCVLDEHQCERCGASFWT